jgi:hypothetical protein
MRLVVAMTGATGSALGIRLLEVDQLGIEHSLINRWKDDQRPIPLNRDRQLSDLPLERAEIL